MKKSVLITTVVLAGLLFVNFAHAVAAPSTAVQAAREKLAEAKQNVVLAKCNVVTNNIDKKITNFNHQKDQHVDSYNKTKDRIQDIITKLEGKGYDVAQLKTDLATFNGKIALFGTDYAKYVSLLTETKDYTCGKSEGDFRAKLAEARAQLKIVHEDSVAIRTFYAKTIRPDVQAVKAQKVPTSTTSTTTTTTNDTSGQ